MESSAILRRMAEKDNFRKPFWISVSVIIGTLVASSVALYFLAGSIEATASAIGAARTQTATQNAELQDLANLKQGASVAATYQAVMDKLLGSQAALLTFPTQIDSLGRAHTVSTSFSFQGSPSLAAGTIPGSIGFSLDVSGSITNVLAFMKDLESSSPVLLSSLENVSVAGDSSSYTLTAKGMVFFK
jgi:hypothetical protein